MTAIIVQQLQGMAAQESKLYLDKAIAQAEVSFYEEQKLVNPEDKLKQKIATAKLEALSKSIETHDSLLEFNENLAVLCFMLSIMSLSIGLFFWINYLPYAQVAAISVSSNATEKPWEEPYSITPRECQQYSVRVKHW
jgi:hypothetical protein